MADDRWPRIKALFSEAVARGHADRDAFLAGSCAGEPLVAREVRSLLEAHDAAGRFIETPAAATVARLAARPLHPPGILLGTYRIIKEIGRGGMGTVYLAARADGSFDKVVALKIVRRGLDCGEIVDRFRHERQTLAGLDHPNIARLLDGGTTDDGLPFFVMEYVEGTPIGRYCDDHHLTVAQRLDIFGTLAMAVHAAHRNLVVHRDLKPDNVLVTADGTLKLLDFGIAKVLAADRAAAPDTRAGWRPMTPEYASPEQVLGLPITTAADIFLLGVLLYELLTGRRPFRRPGCADAPIEREICEADPLKPSAVVLLPPPGAPGEGEPSTAESVSALRRATPAALHRDLAGDLDAIVAKAMRKEPHLRYQSAERLAEDVRRHLAGLPVLARHGALRYRAAKFARRHRVGVAGSALLAAVLAAGVTGVAWQARIAAVERDRARVEADKARQVNGFLQDMLRAPDPQQQGREVTVVDTLDRAARRLETEARMHPEVKAGIRRALGVTYGSLGMFDAAEAQLRATLAALPRDSPEARVHAASVETELADVLSGRGDIAGAQALYLRSLAAFDAAGVGDDLRRAEALNGLGEVLRQRGDDGGAAARYQEALGTRRRLLGDRDILVAESLNNIAVVEHGRNRLAEAEQLYRQSLAIVRTARGDDHPGVPATLTNLATVVTSLGRPDEGERLFRDALAIRRRLLGDAHPEVALTMYALADALSFGGRHAEASVVCREVLARRGSSLPPRHPVVAATLLILGKSLLEQGDARGAEDALGAALALRREILPPGHWQTASAESALGRCLARQGRFREAEPLLTGAYERLEADRGAEHERTIDARANLVDLYERWGRLDKAAEFRPRPPA